jgi:Tol biopolymer transport system component
VFLRDRLRGVTRRLSTAITGQEANDSSGAPAISDDGRVAAFVSFATNLVAGTDQNEQGPSLYLVRLDTRDVSRVGTGTGQHGSIVGVVNTTPSLSADGRLVTFAATPAPVGPGGGLAPSPSEAVYVHDTVSGRTACVSCGAIGRAFDPHVSGDGRFVVYTSETDISRRPRRTDIALHDLTSSVTTLITQFADARSARPKISAGGQVVVFESLASNLVCRLRCSVDDVDANLLSDIYLFDRRTKRFRRVSGGQQPWWVPSLAPSIDADGRVVIFSSRQPFGPEDPSTDFDLFIWSQKAR